MMKTVVVLCKQHRQPFNFTLRPIQHPSHRSHLLTTPEGGGGGGGGGGGPKDREFRHGHPKLQHHSESPQAQIPILDSTAQTHQYQILPYQTTPEIKKK
ncbi:uncharacterized protein BP01DRAFT_174360 [Aspergillus saccharolyticus JOP 1030-1]|uniref:Uncharacterized protein n=1 Tax=Aspergillus saccharolyticus JOP 1030-1 TaxID=1450539 RepID=A0A318ZK86_9EURO|nr:hypothetical protein BP01DRAFT_174360 [Aspergillus saccharolyticus JOP 1030-1]PYH48001.1 hypothetical protein BP01DRAFT_174360 [Aspergillus saccharolyticus JOP 1030-1]